MVGKITLITTIMQIRKLVLSLLFSVSVYAVSAQSVGLVLSGGGAKGLSHIGAIKALEENGIPIDYVAGTSMGAIVAGLYSIGLSPDEMMVLFRSKEFESWYKNFSGCDVINFDELGTPFVGEYKRANNWLALIHFACAHILFDMAIYG